MKTQYLSGKEYTWLYSKLQDMIPRELDLIPSRVNNIQGFVLEPQGMILVNLRLETMSNS